MRERGKQGVYYSGIALLQKRRFVLLVVGTTRVDRTVLFCDNTERRFSVCPLRSRYEMLITWRRALNASWEESSITPFFENSLCAVFLLLFRGARGTHARAQTTCTNRVA